MSVAAVIPCRNGAAFLAEAIASVHAQTLPVDELIVVDDRSTDRSAEIASAGGAVTLQAPAPGGVSLARNTGWRHARSDLIAFLDADDRWRPEHVATMVALLDAHAGAVLAFGGIELFGIASGRFKHHLPATDTPVDARIPCAMECSVPQMAVIVRRAALESIGGYDESLRVAEDFELFARLARLGPFVSASAVTADYRQHEGQATRDRRLEVSTGAMQVRNKNLAALRSELTPSQVADLEQHMRDAWERSLHSLWRDGERTGIETLLAARSHVPGSRAIAERWQRRMRLGWPAWYSVLFVGRRLRLRQAWSATIGRVVGQGKDHT